MIITRRGRYYQTRRESIDWIIAALFGVGIGLAVLFVAIVFLELQYG